MNVNIVFRLEEFDWCDLIMKGQDFEEQKFGFGRVKDGIADFTTAILCLAKGEPTETRLVFSRSETCRTQIQIEIFSSSDYWGVAEMKESVLKFRRRFQLYDIIEESLVALSKIEENYGLEKFNRNMMGLSAFPLERIEELKILHACSQQ